MSKGTTSYRIKDESAAYFLTFTTVNWIDVFTAKKYRDALVDGLAYCQKEKGLQLIGWVVMSNHAHLIAQAREGFELSGIVRDLKKHTSRQIIKLIHVEPESRKEWLMHEMLKAAKQSSKVQAHQLWRNDNHPIQLFTAEVTQQKLDYIHQNPVVAGIVEYPEEYIYSSAKVYRGVKGLLDLEAI